jgi:hypothetical protein
LWKRNGAWMNWLDLNLKIGSLQLVMTLGKVEPESEPEVEPMPALPPLAQLEAEEAFGFRTGSGWG